MAKIMQTISHWQANAIDIFEFGFELYIRVTSKTCFARNAIIGTSMNSPISKWKR